MGLVLPVDQVEVPGHHQNAELSRTLDLHAVEAHVPDARIGVADYDKAGRDEPPSVPLARDVGGQGSHVHLVPRLDDFLDRAVIDHDGLSQVLGPPRELFYHAFQGDVEREGGMLKVRGGHA